MDVELWRPEAVRVLERSGLVLLPVEISQGRAYLAQSMLISPPRHPFWLEFMEFVARGYREQCSAPENTGPLALTSFFLRSGGCRLWEQQGVPVLFDLSGNP